MKIAIVAVILGVIVISVLILRDGRRDNVAGEEPVGDVSDWYKINWDEESIYLDVRTSEPWQATIKWNEIEKACIKIEPDSMLGVSNGLYIWIAGRENSYAIPFDGEKGWDLVQELPTRGIFTHEILTKAMATVDGIFCWPEE